MEIGAQLLANTQRTLKGTADNVSNLNTPGYKNSLLFNDLISSQAMPPNGVSNNSDSLHDMSAGALKQTGNPYDLAITSNGMFQVRAGERTLFTRNGSLDVDAEGRLITEQGYALQRAEGGDIFLQQGQVQILPDGTLLQDGLPIAKVGVFDIGANRLTPYAGGVYFSIQGDERPPAVDQPGIEQGMLEGSNTVLADEMVGMMTAVREAETASRIIQTYDTLLDQAVTTFRRGGR
ncbi:MAG: flagellar hook basal-body protein [Pseudomonadota bacterium]